MDGWSSDETDWPGRPRPARDSRTDRDSQTDAEERILVGDRTMRVRRRRTGRVRWRPVPVIAARAGGIPGVVDDGANGLLVPFADVGGLASAAERLITDETFARRIGDAGRNKVNAQYSWAVVARRVLDNYRRVLAAR